MKSGVKLFSANVVGSKNDLAILVKNLATVEAGDGGAPFRADVAIFIQTLAEVVNQQSVNLHSETVKLYQALARKKPKFDGGSYFIELPLNARVEALTLMFPIAQSLNMILYVDEPNYGYIFCPDGQVFGGDGIRKWQDVVKDVDFSLYPFARNATEFKKIAQPAFAELAASHGFTKKKMPYMDNMGYMRQFEEIYQHIGVEYESHGFDFFVCPAIFLCINQVEVIAEKFGFSDDYKKSFSFYIDLGSYAFGKIVRDWNVASFGDIEKVFSKIDKFIFSEVFELTKDIKSADQFINGNIENIYYKDMYIIGYNLASSLILARLAGNPNFEKLVEHAESQKHWGGKQRAREKSWPALLKYLREEVKPIV